MKGKLILLFSLFGLAQLGSLCRPTEEPSCYIKKKIIDYDSLRLRAWNTAKFNAVVAGDADTLYRNSFALEFVFETNSIENIIFDSDCGDDLRIYRDTLKAITIWGIDLENSDTVNLTSSFVDYHKTPLLDLATEQLFRTEVEPTNYRLIPFKALFKVEATFSSGKRFRVAKRLNFWK